MSEIVPDGWVESCVSDHFELWIGGTPSRGNEIYWDKEKETNNKWVSIRDIKHRYISDTEERVSDFGVKKSNVKPIPKDTVIMSFKLTIGRLTITKCPVFTNEAIVSFIPKTLNSVDTNYLYYGLQSWNLLGEVDQAVKGATLNKDKMSRILGLFPPLPEQKKIASILTSVDEVIENTQKQIDKLQDLKKATMNELLTKGIGHTQFKDSELGRIPQSWEVVRFQDVFASYTYGPRFSSKDYNLEGNVKTIRGTDLTKEWEINYKQVPLAKLDNRVVSQHKLQSDDVVMITTADCGFSAVFQEQKIPYIASAYAIRLRPKENLNSFYCVCYLQTAAAKKQIEKYERKGTVSNLPGSDVMKVKLPLPPLHEQKRMVSALNSISQNLSEQSQKLQQTQSLKKSLMQDLLTGKVRVTV